MDDTYQERLFFGFWIECVMSRAFLFPGQGAQQIGMGQDLVCSYPESQAVFDEVDDALGERLSNIIWGDDQDTLTLTRNTQPALLAMSIAVMRALKTHGLQIHQAHYVAGHSLGEYSALVAANALSLFDAARLVRLRGVAMQEAVPLGEGAMAAIIGLDIDTVKSIISDASHSKLCQVANDNDCSQVVVSGHREAVQAVVTLAEGRGARRAIMLPVSAPFHCTLMEPAATVMAEALSTVTISRPTVPLLPNVSASPVSDPATIRSLLVDQVTGVVRWRETIMALGRLGITETWEIGAGKALSGMVRRIERNMITRQIASPSDIMKIVDHGV